MMNRPRPGPDLELEDQVDSWLHDTDLEPEEADRGLVRLMETFPATPQTRRRSLGRWLIRGGGTRRGTAEHAHPPDARRRNRIMFTATTVAAALALLAVSVSVVDLDGSTTRIVAADGSSDYESITQAVAAAEPGDIIVVRAGTYEESVVVDKDLTITGDSNGGETIVRVPDPDGPQEWSDRNFAFRLQDADVDLGHFTVQGQSEVTPIYVSGGDVTVHDILDDLYAREGRVGTSFFVWIDGDTTGTIRDIVTRSSLSIAGAAKPDVLGNRIGGIVIVADRATPRIVDNQLASIEVHHQAAPIIQDNVVDLETNTNSQPAECGLSVSAKAPGPTVLRNEIRNGSVGICARLSSGGTYVGNQVANAHTGVLVMGSDATFRDNAISGGTNGIAVSDGSPMFEGNTVEGVEYGLVLTMFATPILQGNTFCGNGMDFLPVVGATPPDLSGNTFCGGSTGAAGHGVAVEVGSPAAAMPAPGDPASCTSTRGFVRPAIDEVPAPACGADMP